MPIYNYKCANGHVVEKILLIAERETPGPCPACQGDLERVYLARGRHANAFDPIVLHRSASGEYSFPMHPSAPIPEGFEKLEVTTFQELDRHMGSINAAERRKMEEHVEGERVWLNRIESENRSELRRQMQHMSPVMRAFAEVAMQQNDQKPRPRVIDPNVFAEIRERDASNREDHRDSLTGWQRRRG